MQSHFLTTAKCAIFTLLFTLPSCATHSREAIQHVLLLKLDDPSRRTALIEDCDRLLPGIEGVVSYWSGTPDESGRVSPAIDSNWDVALCVGYPNEAAYAAYVIDPAHIKLVSTWKPELLWLRIHDVSVRHNQ
jgi:hypothetical protein